MHMRSYHCDPDKLGKKKGSCPCTDLGSAFCSLLECAAGGLFGCQFLFECEYQWPTVMSLPEFLREGGEASYRIMNRLSHLIQNLDISGLGSPFPFSPTSRKNSWRDWDDEIMQLETNPPRAADISLDLRKQFAFLSGGRGDNGSPIIVFPEFPAFGEITDREFHNVLTYLTSVPSLSSTDVGFILVIDRRQDRWAAVKGTLLRIAGSFPGNLQLVLVLRPTTLLQRTLSDILFKFNKDEFKMKVPVRITSFSGL
ncbi:hypothetical protein CHARACLAT_015250 [Characodon lateralis]|uniref:CRAL-TRIO domain-containing protein n=1 Tax=Characodon lateralis TaxID=208331 RepID=A0ABU7CXV0_9TELE|nr:hypothetical protein [Characodon lateralis]